MESFKYILHIKLCKCITRNALSLVRIPQPPGPRIEFFGIDFVLVKALT